MSRRGAAIRAPSTLPVDAGDRAWLFVKVETQDGLIGWGEASLSWQIRAVAGHVEDLAELVIGEDAGRVEHLWQTMYRQLFYKGGAVTMSAIAGIDQALWDLKAKALGVPLHELLGGRVRDRVRVYDHLYRWTLGLDFDSHSGLAEAARRSVADGFDAVKTYPIPTGRPLEGTAALREAEAYVGAIRDAVGPEVDIGIDMHGRTTPAMAIEYARLLEPFCPMFLEEPCQPEDVEGHALVARATSIPIATGERHLSRWEFQRLFDRRACAVVQPDVCHAGGVSEVRRIAAAAETYSISVAPHCPAGPIGAAHTVQLALAIPNFLIMEQLREDVPWRDELVDRPLTIARGHIEPPDGPGIGLELVEEAAAAHPPVRRVTYRSYAPDGAVVDD